MAMPTDFDILWGASEIARAIGRSTRETYHLLQTARLRGPKKVGGRWCVTRLALLENFQPPDPSNGEGA
jgi:hypothetical protein